MHPAKRITGARRVGALGRPVSRRIPGPERKPGAVARRELIAGRGMRLYVFREQGARSSLPGAVDGYAAIELTADGLVREPGAVAKPSESLPPPAPAIPAPGKIVCVGLNYRDHVSEGASREVPDWPLLFAKFANAVIADGEPIVRPEGTNALDLEVELGVVIGRRARRVPVDEALAHVAGYVVVNDISARDWQGNKAALREGQKGDGQWLRAKGSDTFLPMGPIFVTADELAPATGLRLRSWRIPGPDRPGAGEPRLMQDGTTADLIFPVPELIALISRHITLERGDVIATGTPAGVGVFRNPPVFLEPGDRVRCEIDGIGSVENPIVDWTDDPRS
jgi:2-keto-4-pentenoate hydratase/2-oxohepta-3-ene-1,7-dioic acid hydratase in catechol pathway